VKKIEAKLQRIVDKDEFHKLVDQMIEEFKRWLFANGTAC
jgi:hypothetical protein